MKELFISGIAAMGLCGCMAEADVPSDGPTVNSADFEVIAGDDWVGTLTYVDYMSGKRISIQTAATVEIASPSVIKYTVSYPDEPWEDAKAKLKLSKSGRLFDGHPVKTREVREDGALRFTTEYAGEDDNAPADIRMTYQLAAKRFSITKDVRPEGAPDFTNRNVYMYVRE